jgi:hypothetical protein
VCQKGGWQQVVRADDTAFKNQGECVSYAAGGGTLTPALPDLVPVLACDHSGCTLSVQNVGNAVANGSIGWALDISEVGHSGNACSGNAAISLAPSATSNVVGSCSGVVEGLSPIAAIATASVDTANAISESDETNNTTSQPFTLFPA